MSGEGVNPPVRPPSLEERLAEDRTSGVVTFRKAVSVRVRREEASRPDMVAEVVGRVLADRKGSYCRDLKGWLVGYQGVRVALPAGSLYCRVKARWFVFQPSVGSELGVTFLRREEGRAVCRAQVGCTQKTVEVDVEGVEETQLSELHQGQSLVVRLTSAGDFSSVPGEREDFHLSGCLIEVVPHHHGSHIQLVDMEAMAMSSDDDLDTVSQDSGLYSHGGRRSATREVLEDVEEEGRGKRKVEEEEEDKAPPRAKRMKRESEGDVVPPLEKSRKSRKKEESEGDLVPPIAPEAEKIKKSKKKAGKNVEEVPDEEVVNEVFDPQTAGEATPERPKAVKGSASSRKAASDAETTGAPSSPCREKAEGGQDATEASPKRRKADKKVDGGGGSEGTHLETGENRAQGKYSKHYVEGVIPAPAPGVASPKKKVKETKELPSPAPGAASPKKKVKETKELPSLTPGVASPKKKVKETKELPSPTPVESSPKKKVKESKDIQTPGYRDISPKKKVKNIKELAEAAASTAETVATPKPNYSAAPLAFQAFNSAAEVPPAAAAPPPPPAAAAAPASSQLLACIEESRTGGRKVLRHACSGETFRSKKDALAWMKDTPGHTGPSREKEDKELSGESSSDSEDSEDEEKVETKFVKESEKVKTAAKPEIEEGAASKPLPARRKSVAESSLDRKEQESFEKLCEGRKAKVVPLLKCFKRGRKGSKQVQIHSCTGETFSNVGEVRAWMKTNPGHTGPDSPAAAASGDVTAASGDTTEASSDLDAAPGDAGASAQKAILKCFKHSRGGVGKKQVHTHLCTGQVFASAADVKAWMKDNPGHTGPDTASGDVGDRENTKDDGKVESEETKKGPLKTLKKQEVQGQVKSSPAKEFLAKKKLEKDSKGEEKNEAESDSDSDDESDSESQPGAAKKNETLSKKKQSVESSSGESSSDSESEDEAPAKAPTKAPAKAAAIPAVEAKAAPAVLQTAGESSDDSSGTGSSSEDETVKKSPTAKVANSPKANSANSLTAKVANSPTAKVVNSSTAKVANSSAAMAANQPPPEKAAARDSGHSSSSSEDEASREMADRRSQTQRTPDNSSSSGEDEEAATVEFSPRVTSTQAPPSQHPPPAAASMPPPPAPPGKGAEKKSSKKGEEKSESATKPKVTAVKAAAKKPESSSSESSSDDDEEVETKPPAAKMAAPTFPQPSSSSNPSPAASKLREEMSSGTSKLSASPSRPVPASPKSKESKKHKESLKLNESVKLSDSLKTSTESVPALPNQPQSEKKSKKKSEQREKKTEDAEESPRLSSTVCGNKTMTSLKIQEAECSPILAPSKSKKLNTVPIKGIIKDYFGKTFEGEEEHKEKVKEKKVEQDESSDVKKKKKKKKNKDNKSFDAGFM